MRKSLNSIIPFLVILVLFGAYVEAGDVEVKDVDFYGKVIRVKSLKKLRPEIRTIPINSSLTGILGSYIAQKELKGKDGLFGITRQRAFQIVKEARCKAGIERDRAHPHTFRHSFAVHCVLNQVPLPVLKKWLGHSSISRTMVYVQVLAKDTRSFYEAIAF